MTAEIIIAEGQFDAMTLAERGYPVVGIPGNSSLKAEWVEKLAARGVEVAYVVLDTGEPGGEEKRAAIGSRLRVAGIDAVDLYLPLTSKDVNDFFYKDGGTKEQFDELLAATKADYERRLYPLDTKSYWPDWEALTKVRMGRTLLGPATGFEQFDLKMMGLRGVYALAGMPGAGKTSLCLQIGWQVALINGVPVIYVSMEMFRDQIMEKTVSRLAEAPYRVVALAGLWEKKGESKLAAAKKAINEVGNLFYLIDRFDRPSMNGIIDMVRRVKRRHKSERALVVFDSLQNLCAYNRGDDGRLTTKQILDDMMMRVYEAAHREGFEAILVSHVPKSAKGKVDQFVFSGSGGIDFESDVTMLLSEPKRDTNVEEDDDDGLPPMRSATPSGAKRIRLSILKNRFGPANDFDFLFHPEFSQFEEA